MTDSEFNTTTVKFEDLGSTEVDVIVAMIKSGGAILSSTKTIRARLANSYWIAVARSGSDNAIVGVAALKCPDQGYRGRIFVDAACSIADFKNAPELGYVTVVESARRRGLAEGLIGELAKRLNGPTYATTGNDTMIRHLAKVGFKQVSNKWEGNDGKLSLLVTLA